MGVLVGRSQPPGRSVVRGYGDLGAPLDIYEDPHGDECKGCPECSPRPVSEPLPPRPLWSPMDPEELAAIRAAQAWTEVQP